VIAIVDAYEAGAAHSQGDYTPTHCQSTGVRRLSTSFGPKDARLYVVWRLEGTVEQVREALSPRYRSSYNTIQTVLNRLVERKLLTRNKHGNAFVYTPRLSEAKYVEQSVMSSLALSQQHDPLALASAICKAAVTSAAKRAAMKLHGRGNVTSRLRLLLETPPVSRPRC
jgi:predicted transcriptional regulator